ncbi:hypothetical protein D9613_001296 [Agrocybe pediades]|uniref:MYND-type domain-containing protein n=1 Tax=Agrocybe pediades TaxID=84607 RepID=A0A8H4VX75_9AGAR|nr:hypothetical protein D9613_001296 [Agrocybe pediades]
MEGCLHFNDVEVTGKLNVNALPSQLDEKATMQLKIWRKARKTAIKAGRGDNPIVLVSFEHHEHSIILGIEITPQAYLSSLGHPTPVELKLRFRPELFIPLVEEDLPLWKQIVNKINGYIRADKENKLKLTATMTENDKEYIRALGRVNGVRRDIRAAAVPVIHKFVDHPRSRPLTVRETLPIKGKHDFAGAAAPLSLSRSPNQTLFISPTSQPQFAPSMEDSAEQEIQNAQIAIRGPLNDTTQTVTRYKDNGLYYEPRSVDKMPNTECDNCLKVRGKGTSLKKCIQCGKAFYCSKECQRTAWPSHKEDCRDIAWADALLRLLMHPPLLHALRVAIIQKIGVTNAKDCWSIVLDIFLAPVNENDKIGLLTGPWSFFKEAAKMMGYPMLNQFNVFLGPTSEIQSLEDSAMATEHITLWRNSREMAVNSGRGEHPIVVLQIKYHNTSSFFGIEMKPEAYLDVCGSPPPSYLSLHLPLEQEAKVSRELPDWEMTLE